MTKKGIFFVLIIMCVLTVMIVSYWGVVADLPDNVTIKKVSIKNSDGESYEVIDRKEIELDAGKGNTTYTYYFEVDVITDRIITSDNIDYTYSVSTTGSENNYTLIEMTYQQWCTSCNITELSLDERNQQDIVYDEDGEVESYTMHFYYKVDFSNISFTSINVNITRFSKALVNQILEVSFKEYTEGSGDVGRDF